MFPFKEALETATLIGLSPFEFWKLTPYEFSLMVKAYIQKMEQEAEEKITLAYMNALWSAQWFTKKQPPTLKEILKRMKQKQEMTPEQMLNIVKALNAALGGEVKYGD